MKYFSIPAILFLIISAEQATGQGCSDAGFCSIINHPPAGHDSAGVKSEKNKINLSAVYGKSDFRIDIFSSSLSYSRKINEKFSVDGKIGFQSASGELGKAFGVNDVFLTFQYSSLKENRSYNTLLGIKIPLHNSAATYSSIYLPYNIISLPMPYQPGQGTMDIIAGYELGWKNFSMSVGLQLPVRNQNENSFLPDSSSEILVKYLPTNDFERKADVLLRAKYSIQPLKSKFTFTGGILPIYHLDDDTYADSAGVRHIIAGSKGLTLNVNLFIQYHVNIKSNFILSFGAPAVARENRPDGLTRKFIVALDYNFNF